MVDGGDGGDDGCDLGDLQEAEATQALKGSTDEDICEGVPEAKSHDPDMLPHEYDDEQIDDLFPRAQVQEDSHDDVVDYEPGNHEIVFGPSLGRCVEAAAGSLACPVGVGKTLPPDGDAWGRVGGGARRAPEEYLPTVARGRHEVAAHDHHG